MEKDEIFEVGTAAEIKPSMPSMIVGEILGAS